MCYMNRLLNNLRGRSTHVTSLRFDQCSSTQIRHGSLRNLQTQLSCFPDIFYEYCMPFIHILPKRMWSKKHAYISGSLNETQTSNDSCEHNPNNGTLGRLETIYLVPCKRYFCLITNTSTSTPGPGWTNTVNERRGCCCAFKQNQC